MNTSIRIAVGMFAGLIAGTMFVGTAVAAPRMMAPPTYGGYGMMRSLITSDALDIPAVAEMNSFMERYRGVNGMIDVKLMHADLASGKVAPPHTRPSPRTVNAPRPLHGRTSSGRGFAMMRSLTPPRNTTGDGMMGSTY
jgi:hypothetical protein